MNRLFSNLASEGVTLKHQPGSLWGCTALVSGTAVGAGILALPAATWDSGILPSTVILVGVWLYMVTSGLLVAEVSLRAMHRLGRPGTGLLAATTLNLGKRGALVAGAIYVFLHYAMLVAYLSRGGDILLTALVEPLQRSTASLAMFAELPASALGAGLFAILFGSILYFGSESLVNKLNSLFALVVFVSFGVLLTLALVDVKPEQLLYQNWAATTAAVPIMFVALVYHHVVPVVATQLEGDTQKIRQAIVVGSAIPLVMLLVWNAAMLGSVGSEIVQHAGNDMVFDPLEMLRHGRSGGWLGATVSIFSEFAIATSFVGMLYGLLNFFGDLFRLQASETSNQLWLYALVLLPPIVLAAFNSSIFLTALDYAGAFGISVLFGLLPAIIVWKQRYHHPQPLNRFLLVPGGKTTLAATIAIAAAVVSEQVLAKTGLI